MEWLVWIHVVSAIVGIGPTYVGHILLRKKQEREQLLQSLALFKLLDVFPKIGGSIAVVSGIALVADSGWKFTDMWILVSLVLYVLIQLVVLGMLRPILGQLIEALNAGEEQVGESTLRMKRSALLAKANGLYNTASILGIVLISLMIIKPM